MFARPKRFYFLSGLPRAGNTLLGSLLNQNKSISTTGLSPVVDLLYQIEYLKTKDLKCKNFPDTNSLEAVGKNIFKLYYQGWKSKYIIDRGCWGTPDNLALAKQYCPNKPKIIVLVRDLYEILGSFIYWSLNNPGNFLDQYKSVEEKCDYLMSENGQIVKCLYAAANLHKPEHNSMSLFINYQSLIENPKSVVKNLYRFLGIPEYHHNFSDIKQFSVNSMEYNDSCVGTNLHLVKPTISKSNYSYQDILPSSVLDKYSKYNASYLKTNGF